MRVAATIEVPGKVLVIADGVEPCDGVCIRSPIPGGDLYVDGALRGIAVSVGMIDYEKIIDSRGDICDWLVHSTTLDVLLDL